MLVGHGSSINTYLALANGTLFSSVKEEDAKRHVPRGRKRVAYKRAMLGLVMLGIYSAASPFFNYGIILQDAWLKKPLWLR